MLFQVSFKNMESSEALGAYAHERIEPAVSKLVQRPVSVSVTFSIDNRVHKVRCHVVGGGGVNLQITQEGSDMYQSIDHLLNRLEEQMRRQKEKKGAHKFENFKILKQKSELTDSEENQQDPADDDL